MIEVAFAGRNLSTRKSKVASNTGHCKVEEHDDDAMMSRNAYYIQHLRVTWRCPSLDM